MNSSDPTPSCRLTKVEVTKELPKVSMVNTSLKKLKHHLAGFDVIVKERTTATTITKGSLQEKVLVITTLKNELRKHKRKELANNVVTKNTIDPEMLKIDVEPINPRLLNNRAAHSDYLKHTQKEALRLIAYIIIGQTCPSINNSGDKLVAVTPKNKDKRVRFTEPVTSLGNTHPKTDSSSNLVSNKPVLCSTGVRPSTSASGSQPSGNTMKDKIQRTPSSTQKNKVEAHPRTVKSRLKNKNCFVEPKRNANVQYSKLNANSKLLCVKCNGCMLSDNHDLCLLDFINDVNARNKSKSVVQIVLWYLDSGCSKHMIGDRSQLTNFINKFLGTFKFGNDHVVKILGYGDYQIGNVTFKFGNDHVVKTMWKDLDITYSPLGNSVIRTLKLLFVNTPALFVI
ncbi:hypothetical protein Tco_1297368 [Tanacetum coccineum]